MSSNSGYGKLALAGSAGAVGGYGAATGGLGSVGASVGGILAGTKTILTGLSLSNPLLAGAALAGGIGYVGKRVLFDWLVMGKLMGKGGGHGDSHGGGH